MERPRGATLQPTETSNAQQLDEVLHVAGVREFTRELNFKQCVVFVVLKYDVRCTLKHDVSCISSNNNNGLCTYNIW